MFMFSLSRWLWRGRGCLHRCRRHNDHNYTDLSNLCAIPCCSRHWYHLANAYASIDCLRRPCCEWTAIVVWKIAEKREERKLWMKSRWHSQAQGNYLPQWESCNTRRMTETGVFHHLPSQRKEFRSNREQRRNEFAQLRRRLIHAHLVQCQRFFRFSFAIVATIDRRKLTNTFHSAWIRFFHRYTLFDVLVFRSFLWHFRFVLQHLSLPLAGRPFSSRCYARHLLIVQRRRQLDCARWRRRWWRTAQCAANIRRYAADGAEIRAHACRAGYRWWAVGGNCTVWTPWLCYGLRTEFNTRWVCEYGDENLSNAQEGTS